MTYIPTRRKKIPVYSLIGNELHGKTLEEAVKYFNKIIEMYGSRTKLDFNRHVNNYGAQDDDYDLAIVTYRDETDKEMSQRHADEAKLYALKERSAKAEIAKVAESLGMTVEELLALKKK